MGWRGACGAYAAIHLLVCLPIYLWALPGVRAANGDAEGLAQAIRELRAAPGRLREMGERGRQWMQRDFAGDAIGARMLDLYEGRTQANQGARGRESWLGKEVKLL